MVVRRVTSTVALSLAPPATVSAGTLHVTGPVPLQAMPDVETNEVVAGIASVSVVADAGVLPLFDTRTE